MRNGAELDEYRDTFEEACLVVVGMLDGMRERESDACWLEIVRLQQSIDRVGAAFGSPDERQA